MSYMLFCWTLQRSEEGDVGAGRREEEWKRGKRGFSGPAGATPEAIAMYRQGESERARSWQRMSSTYWAGRGGMYLTPGSLPPPITSVVVDDWCYCDEEI
jgi:hypothetical protein